MWQLVTFQYTLKWDAIDITFPWRYFTSDALRHGILPLWNPYQHQGFAQGTAPETWYPIGLLLGITRGYSLYSLNLEYLLHLAIASIGFYRLAKTLHLDADCALWGALVFPLSGFFIGNAQHMGWITAGAWIPHVFHTYLQFRHTYNWKYGAYFVVSFYMLVSGGYTAFAIVSTYMLALLFIYDLIVKVLMRRHTISHLRQHLRLLVLTVTTCSIILVCLIALKQHIYRGYGLSDAASIKGSTYFKHLLSLFFPLPSTKGPIEFWHTDQALINVYIGLGGLLLALTSLRFLRLPFFKTAWIFLALFLGLALGEELPLRTWLNALPLFDLFRYPSLFRYYVVLILLLLGVRSTMEIRKNPDMRRWLSKMVQVSCLLCISTAVIYAWFDPDTWTNVTNFSISSIREATALQLVVNSSLLFVFYLLLRRRSLGRRLDLPVALLIFSGIDMMIATQLNGRVSVFSEDKLATVARCVEKLPEGYPKPLLQDYIGTNADSYLATGFLYRNTNTLYKRIGWNGYTPYQYQKYITLENSPHFAKNLNLPAIYLSPYHHKAHGSDYFESQPDLEMTQRELDIIDFDPNQITLLINTPTTRLLVYNQNLVDGWKGYMGDQILKPVYADTGLIGFILPKGKYQLRLTYKPGYLINGLWITGFLLLCLIVALWGQHLYHHRSWAGYTLILIVAMGLLLYQPPNAMVASTPMTGRKIINHIDDSQRMTELAEDEIVDRFLDRGDLSRFQQLIDNTPTPFTYLFRSTCLSESQIFQQYLSKNFVVIDTSSGSYKGVICQRKSSDAHNIIFSTINGFEGEITAWRNTLQGHHRASNGNSYQDLKDRTYSATYEYTLDTVTEIDRIKIDLDVRVTGHVEASIICSISHKGESLFWRSQGLGSGEGEIWTRKEWEIPLQTSFPADAAVGVYVWNPKGTSLQIDNIKVAGTRR